MAAQSTSTASLCSPLESLVRLHTTSRQPHACFGRPRRAPAVHPRALGRTGNGEASSSFTLLQLPVVIPVAAPLRISRSFIKRVRRQLVSHLDADSATRFLLGWSVVPALLLAVQPLLAPPAPAAAAAAPVAWQGPLCDMFSFTVLLGVFITCEPAAALASAVSAAGAGLILALNASQLPGHAVATTTLLASAAAATLWAATKGSTQAPVVPEEATAPTQQQQQQQVQWCREVTATAAEQEHSRMHALPSNPVALSRNADSRVSTSTPVVAAAVLAEGGAAVSNDFGDAGSWAISDEQQQLQQQHQVPSAAQHSALDQIQEALGVLGGGLLLQFCWSLTQPLTGCQQASSTWVAAVAAGAAAVVAAGKLLSATAAGHDVQFDRWQQQLRADWPAWSATLLLIGQGLQQLVNAALSPYELLPTISGQVVLLLVLANGLMVPRALHTRQFMWFTGTCSGTLLAAGQLLLLALQSLLLGGNLASSTQPLASTTAAAAASRTVGACRGVAGSCSGSVLSVAVVVLWLCVSGAVLQRGWQYILSQDS